MLSRSFFKRDPLSCARELIGCRLQWGELSGIITETEAYDVEGDEAAHTFFRPSARVFVESHQAGDAYVYLNYGVHWMLNVMVQGSRTGFVLMRGLEPLTGIEQMKRARQTEVLSQLCSGPGKLAKALGITGESHGMDLCEDPRFGFHREKGKMEVGVSPRIGITRAADLPWRFYALGNVHISAHPKGWKGDRPVRG
ncbi:DNA-3-methyladenine glycosylase [soil metagenome]